MKIVRDPRYTFKNSVPGSAIVRIVFGGILASIFFIFLSDAIDSIAYYHGEDAAFDLIMGLQFLIGGGLLILFGVRALVLAKKNATIYASPNVYVWDPNQLYFTVTCPTCQAPFDYQQADLGFRAWYPNGYVECPCCKKPIRHNAAQNTFVPPVPTNYPTYY